MTVSLRELVCVVFVGESRLDDASIKSMWHFGGEPIHEACAPEAGSYRSIMLGVGLSLALFIAQHMYANGDGLEEAAGRWSGGIFKGIFLWNIGNVLHWAP